MTEARGPEASLTDCMEDLKRFVTTETADFDASVSDHSEFLSTGPRDSEGSADSARDSEKASQ